MLLLKAKSVPLRSAAASCKCGAGRAFFTGRSGLASGIEMLLIGAAAAGAAYLIGALVASMIAG